MRLHVAFALHLGGSHQNDNVFLTTEVTTMMKNRRSLWIVLIALATGLAAAPAEGCSYCTDNPDNCA